MIKKITVIVCACAAVLLLATNIRHQPGPATNSRSCKEVIDEALAKAKADHKLVLVKFGSSWCVPCRNLEALLHSEDMSKLLDKHFDVVIIHYSEDPQHADLENAGAIDWMKEHDIQPSLPTMTILDKTGKVIRTSGHPSNEFTLPPVDGPPFSYAQVGSFLHFIAESCHAVTPADLQKMRGVLENYLNKIPA